MPRFSAPVVVAVALLSAALGFVVRGFVTPPRTQVTVTLPPPVTEPARPPAPVPEVEEVPDAQVAAPAEVAVVAAAPVAEVVPTPAAPSPPEPRRITLPYEHLEGLAQRIIIPVTLNGRHTVKMALDTGAPGTILSAHAATRLGLIDAAEGRLLTQAGGIGGTASATLVVLDSIAIGEARSEFVPATITDGKLSDAWDGLVGMDFLAGYEISIDSAKHVLVLTEQPASASAPAGHDESWWRRTYQLLAGQRATWRNVKAALELKKARSDISAGGEADKLDALLAFAQAQDREAEVLASKLERYAATHSVPLEWRRP